ncbi:MAG: circularly permuted type 2 ATP-grasp protein [Actinomycetota bacterium]|nr:circularly permuted type 2 ATP-grasp protein [Actinomycetota bacterium]
MKALSPERAPYDVDDRFHDEAFESRGEPRPHYRPVMEALERRDLDGLVEETAGAVRERGVRFGDAGEFAVDPVPRVLAAAEWRELEAGLRQRVRALNAFCADVYSERRIIAEGVMPARVIESADHFEPWMCGVEVRGAWIPVAGLDVVRDARGRFMVLEDNVRTPSGLAYAEVARDVVGGLLEAPGAPGFDAAYEVLGEALRAAAPEGVGDPRVVLLSDGPDNSAWFEHRRIARRLGIAIATLADLDVREVDVIYRRTDVDCLRNPNGRSTELVSLLGPIRRGAIGVVNPPGTGVADDKLVHAYVEEMVRFYLGEEPLLRSVPTYDLAEPSTLAYVLGRLDEVVVKPRADYGGRGVVIGPHAREHDLAQVAKMISARPDRFIAQETIPLSRHPTVCDGRLEPRHVDLRSFVLTAGEHVHVVPGGLTRVALDRGALVVNSSQNGGGKDTWIGT